MARKLNPEQSVADVIAETGPPKGRPFGINHFHLMWNYTCSNCSDDPVLICWSTLYAGSEMVRWPLRVAAVGPLRWIAAVPMLDRSLVRIGNGAYARKNGFGAAAHRDAPRRKARGVKMGVGRELPRTVDGPASRAA